MNKKKRQGWAGCLGLLLAAGSGHARRSYEHIGDD